MATELDPATCVLTCEVSNDGFCYTIIGNNIVRSFANYQFDHAKSSQGFTEHFRQIISDQPLLADSFLKTYIIYSTPDSVLIPFTLYRSEQNNDMLSTIHGDVNKNDIVLTDVLIEEQLYNIYRIKPGIIETIMEKFPGALTFHQYTVLVRQKLKEGNSLLLLIYPRKIVVRAVKNSKIILINSYDYRVIEDVSYSLLNICQLNGLENCQVILGGLIEKDSAIYKDIHKYFADVSFAQPENDFIADPENSDVPVHYYSSLSGVAACE
ncbi:hypothetical protein BH20BAC1_BH20BAC1_26620 [soil metagenome]